MKSISEWKYDIDECFENGDVVEVDGHRTGSSIARFDYMIEKLENHRNVSSFTLDTFVHIDENRWLQLFEALSLQSCLSTLTLSRCNVNGGAGQHLGDWLRSSQSITTLDLYHSRLSKDGYRHLADALRSNQSLTVLNLLHNNLTDVNCLLLADMLLVNCTLQTLRLGDHSLTTSGIASLISALRAANKVSTLMLYHCGDAAHYVFDALRLNQLPSITCLELGNEDERAWWYAVRDMLVGNKSLNELHVDQIDHIGTNPLIAALHTNRTVTTLFCGDYLVDETKQLELKSLIERNGRSINQTIGQSSLHHTVDQPPVINDSSPHHIVDVGLICHDQMDDQMSDHDGDRPPAYEMATASRTELLASCVHMSDNDLMKNLRDDVCMHRTQQIILIRQFSVLPDHLPNKQLLQALSLDRLLTVARSRIPDQLYRCRGRDIIIDCILKESKRMVHQMCWDELRIAAASLDMFESFTARSQMVTTIIHSMETTLPNFMYQVEWQGGQFRLPAHRVKKLIEFGHYHGFNAIKAGTMITLQLRDSDFMPF